MSNKSGTDIISTPQGGGALKGIGEKFSPDLQSGTGNYNVPLELPPGRNGLTPQLSLVYSTGNGNSPFGMGWSLSVPGVTRKTAKGVPIYNDDRDVFVLSGSEDLVTVDETDDARTRYRPRTDAAFARIDHHHARGADGDYWEVRTRDGMIGVYGTPRPEGADGDWRDPAVVADPNPDTPSRRFAWNLSESRDPFGNRITYSYVRDPVEANEACRWDQVYLSEIRYVDYGDPSNPDFLVRVKLHYEERPDPFSDHRAGFEVRTTLRCKRIEVLTEPEGAPNRMRTYHLTYQDELGSPANGGSLLSEIRVEGHDDSRAEPSDRSQFLPPLRFGYGAFDPARRRFEPVQGSDLPAHGLGHGDYELADLFGNGLPDIVQLGTTARYWRNLGEGRFDSPRQFADAPAGLRLSESGVQLLDANGDGRVDLVECRPTRAGYYSLSAEGGRDRRSYRPYERPPSFDLEDPEVKLVDLTGDGVTDVLRSGASFECFFNDPQRGFADTRRVERGRLDVKFSDPRVRLADMTGDGLRDIVLIEEGRVDYWPSLGHGEFGPRRTMSLSSRLPHRFDPRRVLLGDVDGNGAADLVYVEDQKVQLRLNQNGFSWGEPVEIRGTPSVTDTDAVRLVDLLGCGVAGVLWSRDAAGLPRKNMFFLDFTGGHKPYLLERIDSNMGSVTNIKYAPSTRFSLEDRGTPQEWQTPLPFPVQVVSRVESVDQISGGKLTTEYEFHHGYWDGAEREFRGFGRVDQRDTEVFEEYHGHGLGPEERPFENVEPRFFSPPTEHRTWFHVGPVGEEFGEWHEVDYSSEYWSGDKPALKRTREVEEALRALPRRAQRDALRSLRGRILRTELYALDNSERAERPYTVTEQLHGFRTEVVPADADSPWVFFPFTTGERTTQWERGDDPLTQLAFSGDYDANGLPRLQLSVAVPRGRDFRTQAAVSASAFLATHSLTTYAQPVDAMHFIVDRVAHKTTYELVDDGKAGSTDPRPGAMELWTNLVKWRLETGSAPRQQVIGQTLHHYDGNDFEGLPLGQVGSHGVLKRVEQLVLTESILQAGYRSTSTISTTPKEPPYFDRRGVPTWTGDYPDEFRAGISQLAHAPPRGIAVHGGYIFHEGDTDRERGFFATSTQRAHDSRGLVTAERDTLGQQTTITYGDGFDLLPTTVTDAASLETRATYDDYRVLQPKVVTDPNGNETKYEYTPLGLVESIAVLGKPGLSQGDTSSVPSTRFRYDFEALQSTGLPIYTHTTRRTHHVNDPDNADDAIEAREYSDGFGRVLQTRTLAEDALFGSAEFGDDVLPLNQSQNSTPVGRARPDGAPPNVVVGGSQTFDNKGRVVEKFEPFFSTDWAYGAPTERQQGQKVTQHYDSRGRVVRTVNPDGAEQLTVFGVPPNIESPEEFTPTPWESYAYDANDNAGRTHAANPAAATSSEHWNTPTSMVVDALGRTVEQVERNGPNASRDRYTTRQEYDIRGNLLKVWDQLGRLAFQHVYDLADRELRTEQLDAGVRRTVLDAAGDAIEQRDAKGALTLHAADMLRRPTHLWARDRVGEQITLRERGIYGDSTESGLDAREAAEKNLLGKPYKHHDEAGRLLFEEYDFKGNLVEKVRQVISNEEILSAFDGANANNWEIAAYRVEWQHPSTSMLDTYADGLLDAAAYRTSQQFDALNRVKRLDYPRDVDRNRKRLQPVYNRAGALERVLLDGVVFVEHIAYNAKGQRTLIAYGDRDTSKPGPRVMTRYAYDPQTFRLRRLRTEGFASSAEYTFAPTGEPLQDLSYQYDLAGNVRHIVDTTPGCGVRNNSDKPVAGVLMAAGLDESEFASRLRHGDALARRFEFDPLYRLVTATGRECSDIPSPRPWSDDARCGSNSGNHGTPTQGNAPELTSLYTQQYTYDPAGNMTSLRHSRGGSAWTRHFGVGGQTPIQWSEDWPLHLIPWAEVPTNAFLGAAWSNPPSNQLTHVGDNAPRVAATHEFDGAGNLVRETTSRHLEWDHANRLRAFCVQPVGAEPSQHAHYLYDASGQRVKKLVRKQGGRIEVTVYIDGILEHQQVRNGGMPKQYNTLHVMDNERRIATVRVGRDPDDNTPVVKYQLGDHIGSSSVVLDQSGSWVNREEHTPYGETSFGSFAKKRYRFTGKERDGESGLYYHGARYYAPRLGRWISIDRYITHAQGNEKRARSEKRTSSQTRPGRQAALLDTNDSPTRSRGKNRTKTPISVREAGSRKHETNLSDMGDGLSGYTFCRNSPLVRVDTDGNFSGAVVGESGTFHFLDPVRTPIVVGVIAGIGAAVGVAVGGPVGSAIGAAIGAAVGFVVDLALGAFLLKSFFQEVKRTFEALGSVAKAVVELFFGDSSSDSGTRKEERPQSKALIRRNATVRDEALPVDDRDPKKVRNSWRAPAEDYPEEYEPDSADLEGFEKEFSAPLDAGKFEDLSNFDDIPLESLRS